MSIGGFIVTGTLPKKVIVRAIGPSLPVTGKLANPTLELYGPLYGQGNVLIASNDNWKVSDTGGSQQALIEATGVPPTNDLESAIVATLPASPSGLGYTAVMRGVNNTTGVGLVEVYDLDPAATSKLANISTRGQVQTGNDVMIGGIIVTGTSPQRVIVRACGPSLGDAGVTGALQDPTLELRNSNGALLASNDNWRDTGGDRDPRHRCAADQRLGISDRRDIAGQSQRPRLHRDCAGRERNHWRCSRGILRARSLTRLPYGSRQLLEGRGKETCGAPPNIALQIPGRSRNHEPAKPRQLSGFQISIPPRPRSTGAPGSGVSS